MKAMLILAFVLLSSSLFAQTRVVSIDAFDLSYAGGLAFRHDNGKNSDRNETDFRLNLNYAQMCEQYVGLMYKGQLNFDRRRRDFGSSDVFESSYGVAAGFLYNFQAEDIKNSVIAGGMLGIERANYDFPGVKDRSGFNLSLMMEAGKRFDLGQYSVANLSYAPTVSVMFKRYGGGIRDDYFTNGNEVRLNFLKFDILF